MQVKIKLRPVDKKIFIVSPIYKMVLLGEGDLSLFVMDLVSLIYTWNSTTGRFLN